MSVITLIAGNLELELSPSIGGAISGFVSKSGNQTFPILRKCHTPPEKALDACCFPLVPYVNRIRGGTFTFRGREVHLKPNMVGDPSPLHGQGWLNPWAIDHHDESSATLSYRHEAGEWPWSYEAFQEFFLDEDGLSARLSCRNAGTEAMPCGLGFHPYFHCGADTRINTHVDCAWTVDKHVLPVEKVAADGRFDLRNRSVCGQDLDNGFGGWGGTAEMSDPNWPFQLRMSSSEAKFFQLYSPPEGGIFVAEPVTHANAALNHPESEWPKLGMRILNSGEAMGLDMRIEVILHELQRGGSRAVEHGDGL